MDHRVNHVPLKSVNPLDILFEPLVTPNITFKNRFFMAPIGTRFNLKQMSDFLVARARGGVGAITTGLIRVHPSGMSRKHDEPALEKDSDLKAWQPLVEAVRKEGAKIIAQLSHPGRYAFAKSTGRQSVAPSAVASLYTGETPRELTLDEADELVSAFASSALRAHQAGFDGIEILASSGYLISQFLSSATNKRTDCYGGPGIMERARFLFLVLRETRNLVGPDFNVCVKFDAEDCVPGGKRLRTRSSLPRQ